MDKFNLNTAILNKIFEGLGEIIYVLESLRDNVEDIYVSDYKNEFTEIDIILKRKFDIEDQELEKVLHNINEIKSYNYDSEFLYLPNEFFEKSYKSFLAGYISRWERLMIILINILKRIIKLIILLL